MPQKAMGGSHGAVIFIPCPHLTLHKWEPIPCLLWFAPAASEGQARGVPHRHRNATRRPRTPLRKLSPNKLPIWNLIPQCATLYLTWTTRCNAASCGGRPLRGLHLRQTLWQGYTRADLRAPMA